MKTNLASWLHFPQINFLRGRTEKLKTWWKLIMLVHNGGKSRWSCWLVKYCSFRGQSLKHYVFLIGLSVDQILLGAACLRLLDHWLWDYQDLMRATCLTTLGIVHKSSQSAKDQTQNEITGCFINSVTKFLQFNLNNDINNIDLNCHLLFRIASNRYSLRHQTRYVSFLHNSGAQ